MLDGKVVRLRLAKTLGERSNHLVAKAAAMALGESRLEKAFPLLAERYAIHRRDGAIRDRTTAALTGGKNQRQLRSVFEREFA